MHRLPTKLAIVPARARPGPAIRLAVSVAVALLSLASIRARAELGTGFLFSYFVGNGEDGLHLAWSADGIHWAALNNGGSYLKPEVGESRLMRDPCLLRGPDGVFQLVWTTAWKGRTIGHATSRDLRHWSPQQAIPVMAQETNVLNCWAPEVVYDDAQHRYLIFWASTVPGRFQETAGKGDDQYNHRIYSTTTEDFKTFSPTRLFYEPGFNVIDATMLRARGHFFLIVKDETRQPPKKHLRIASSDRIDGPFANLSAPFTPDWVEGPSAIRIKDDFVVYFDMYRSHRYGAMRSRDLEHWQDISDELAFPKDARHGTVLAVPGEIIQGLLVPPSDLEHSTTK